MNNYQFVLTFSTDNPLNEALSKDVIELSPNILDCNISNGVILVTCQQEAPCEYDARQAMVREIVKYYKHFKYVA